MFYICGDTEYIRRRLERIVALLETGSSVAVRQTAAKQLGDIAQRFFPTTETQTESVKQEFRHLTTHHRYARSTYEDGWANSVALVYRILPFLASKSMETRLAAVDALNHIAEAVPLWYPETHGEQPDQVMLDPAVDVPGTRIQDLDIQALTKSKEKRQPDTASSGVQGRVASKRRRIDKEPVPNSFLENLGIDSTLVKSESLSDADVDDEIEAFTETQVSIKASSKRPERAQNGPRTSIRPELPPLRKRVKREDSDVESKAEIAPVNGGQDVDLKPLPRRPGRPKGSKNKVHSASLPSSPSSSALLAEEDDIFRGLSGRQVLMLKRKLKSNVVTKEQAKDEAMRYVSASCFGVRSN
ncbi:hypothetical protein QFC19_004793 [Naganishia cerealis]|uniref:Uncharacterized protein n=1 Tax=Naganishia cerealis TaxID=610337 RepID=A0ACC2VS37_9TREE|nr:hypothetical protein QFC19_004793 [Naganishia cerealis]